MANTYLTRTAGSPTDKTNGLMLGLRSKVTSDSNLYL